MLLTLSLSSCTKNTESSKPTVTTAQVKESKTSETTSVQTTADETTSTASTTASETSATQTSESAPSAATIGSGADYNPVINPADFTVKIDNKYFPLVPEQLLYMKV